jgi:hypothetical protein
VDNNKKITSQLQKLPQIPCLHAPERENLKYFAFAFLEPIAYDIQKENDDSQCPSYLAQKRWKISVAEPWNETLVII